MRLAYLLFLHHQPSDLQPFEAFERNLPSQHLPKHLATSRECQVIQTAACVHVPLVAPVGTWFVWLFIEDWDILYNYFYEFMLLKHIEKWELVTKYVQIL